MHQVVLNQPPNFECMFEPGKAVCAQGLLEEVNLFACSPQAAMMYGGPHTKAALHQIMNHSHAISYNRALKDNLQPVIDVRIHRLFPDQFPGVPGWHCDAVPRGGYTGQPNFGLCHPAAFHVALLLSDQLAGVSNTEFVLTPIKVCLEEPYHVYREMHREVQRIKPITEHVRDGRLVWYNQRTIHRVVPAHRRGVRLYLRLSLVEKPLIANVHHSVPQVYQLAEENGW